MKCQISRFLEKKTNIINLSSAELAQKGVGLKHGITKTRLFNYIENFTTKKMKIFR